MTNVAHVGHVSNVPAAAGASNTRESSTLSASTSSASTLETCSTSSPSHQGSAHPLYLVGAFGGAARAVIDLLEGRDRPDVRLPDLGKGAPSTDAILEVAKSRNVTVITSETPVAPASSNPSNSLVTPDRIASDIVSAGRVGLTAALCNGLTDAENQELFRTPDVTRIAELILTGLSRV